MSTYENAFTLKASKFTLTKRNGMKSTNTKNNKSLNNQSEFGKFKYTRPISKNKPKKEFVTLNNDFISFFKKLDIIKKSALTTNRTCTISSSVSHSKRKEKETKFPNKNIKHKEIKITINSSSMNNSIKKKKDNQNKPKKTFTTFNPFHIQFAKPANVKNKNNKTKQDINKKIPINNNPKVNKTIDTNNKTNILYKAANDTIPNLVNTTNDKQIDDELLEDNYISDNNNDDEETENSGVLAYDEVKDIIVYYDMGEYKTKFLFGEGDYSKYITNRRELYVKFFGFKKENCEMKTASTNASSKKTKNNYVSVIKTNK